MKIKLLRIKYLLVLSVFFLSFCSRALNTIFTIDETFDSTLNNTCSVSGYITDRNDKVPIPGTNILLIETNYGAAADVNGYFFIENIPPGMYNIKVSTPGWRSYTKSNVIFKGNHKYKFKIELVDDIHL